MRYGAIHAAAPAAILPLHRLVGLAGLAAPAEVNWLAERAADGDPLGNDTRGNCVQCAKLRAIELRRAAAWGDAWAPTAADALELYGRETGYDPTTGQPDAGTSTAASMREWVQQGVRLGTQVLDLVAWASVDPADGAQVAKALALTGPAQVTVAIVPACQDPGSWAQAPGSGPGWDLAAAEYHRVCLGRWQDGVAGVRSWGRDFDLHPAWWARFVVAVDATLSRDWLDATGRSPAGLDWEQLEAEMKALGG